MSCGSWLPAVRECGQLGCVASRRATIGGRCSGLTAVAAQRVAASLAGLPGAGCHRWRRADAA